MFAIARQALVDMGQFIPGFPASNRNKFCRGFGMFQLDLQFFKGDPDYFLEKRYEKFGETLGRAIGELTDKAKKIGLFNKPSLSDMELTAVAIAYNTGNFIPSKGLNAGPFRRPQILRQADFRIHPYGAHGAGAGWFADIAATATGPRDRAAPYAGRGDRAVPRCQTQLSPLRVRSAPKISSPATANVIAQLPDGHPCAPSRVPRSKKFIEIETSLFGAHIRGFASADFLVAAPAGHGNTDSAAM